ncbi:MAG TPA: hypothetical protein VM510_14415, partial [Caulifigura sp.]|nr:hypothetical protein [Caulifigura sp.]
MSIATNAFNHHPSNRPGTPPAKVRDADRNPRIAAAIGLQAWLMLFAGGCSPSVAPPAPEQTAATPMSIQAAQHGHLVIDPDDSRWLIRQGGRHFFVCGPGDPEDFLYLGRRNADGTRDGDQVARIGKLIEHGGNCIYMQIVRSHGGDAKDDATQNPFIDSDPSKPLDDDILNQWEEWLTIADKHGILTYLFFYDDGARIWD